MQMPSDLATIHIVGIGGIGMSAIAEILRAKGFGVQGSDQKESPNVRRLASKGIKVFVGHAAANLTEASFVVISTAVKDDNPELQAARARGLPIIRRAEMLAELMRLYKTISVTGTHGKTTTSSLISHIFEKAGQDPTVITGGIINSWGSNARLGHGEWMIVEADESDGTFVKIPTQIGVVTNMDPEHLDYFGSVENMYAEYEAFYRNVPFYGLTVSCIDQPVVREMLERLRLRRNGRRLITYGQNSDADMVLLDARVEGSATVFNARLSDRVGGGQRPLIEWMVPVPGTHNALNALAAIAVAAEAGISDEAIKSALASFEGVKRRFQRTGEWQGVAIYDDYGHHPIEINAVLRATKSGAKGRVIAVVEPHRYSRLKDLFPDFCRCFKSADEVVVIPLYSAGEAPLDGISSASLADGIRAQSGKTVATVSDVGQLAELLKQHTKAGDIVVCLGAGVSTEWAHDLPRLMGGEAAAGAQTA
ncbi:MAG: UDP-N-acetylmuramate--L-alanine ligase [Alphaproteobacteria bacterium]|nr:UDP-N-acetylmuramate--L-alanine ligase [Alphaproteobacteria bacterium]